MIILTSIFTHYKESMRIKFIQVEKTSEAYLQEGIQLFTSRLKNYTVLDIITINMPKSVRQKTVAEQKAEEARQILKELSPGDYVVVLDEKGKQFTSVGFANFLGKKQVESTKCVTFIIGGPFGFDEQVYERAAMKLALSEMTFSHQMVRLFFLEQLYRAYSILSNEKYHHQ